MKNKIQIYKSIGFVLSIFGVGLACGAEVHRVEGGEGDSRFEIQPVLDFDPPTVPERVRVSQVGRKICLVWEPSTDAVSGVVGYRIYRNGERLAQVQEALFEDTDAQPGSRYCYQITGVDGVGYESALSTPADVRLTNFSTAGAGVYCYPNPAVGGAAPVIHAESNSLDCAEVKIYDLSGRLIESGELSPQSTGGATLYEFSWAGPIASGIYIAVVETHSGGANVRTPLKIAVIR